MGFRDETEAARARAEALEGQVRDLRVETDKLRDEIDSLKNPAGLNSPRSKTRTRRPGLWFALGCAFLVVGEVVAGLVRPPYDAVLPFAGVLTLACFAVAVASLRIVAGASEMLVVSGRKNRGADGRTVGYRVLSSGAGGFRVPLLENVTRVDLTARPVDVGVSDAYAGGGVRVSLSANAVVGFDRDPSNVHNAIERFVGRPDDELRAVASQTLESALRAVVATMSVDEIEENREKLVQYVQLECGDSLRALGLTLDNLSIGRIDRDTKT